VDTAGVQIPPVPVFELYDGFVVAVDVSVRYVAVCGISLFREFAYENQADSLSSGLDE